MCNEAEPAVTEVDDGQVDDEHTHAVTLRTRGHNFTLYFFLYHHGEELICKPIAS